MNKNIAVSTTAAAAVTTTTLDPTKRGNRRQPHRRDRIPIIIIHILHNIIIHVDVDGVSSRYNIINRCGILCL